MYKVGVLGFDTLIGYEIFNLLKTCDQVQEIYLFTSEDNVEENIENEGDKKIFINQVDEIENISIDILFLSDGKDLSRELYKRKILDRYMFVIDTTGAFKYNEGESNLISHMINSSGLSEKIKENNIISIPLSVSTALSMVLEPIKNMLKRVVVSTYQSVSKYDDDGLEMLFSQASQMLQDGDQIDVNNKNFKNYVAFNAVPEFNKVNDNFQTEEELNILQEVNHLIKTSSNSSQEGQSKNNDDLKISISTVMIGSISGDAMNVNIEFKDDLELDIVETVVKICLNEEVVFINNNDEGESVFMTPSESSDFDKISIGKVQRDTSVKNGMNMWVCWANIKYAYAMNAVRIAMNLLNKNDK